MAAVDHIHPEQLRLFMRPGEIKGAVTESVDMDAPLGSPMEAMWAGKERESREPIKDEVQHGAGLYERLRTEQVREPVVLKVEPGKSMKQSLWMGEGHHRTAASHTAERDVRMTHWLPVEYEEMS